MQASKIMAQLLQPEKVRKIKLLLGQLQSPAQCIWAFDSLKAESAPLWILKLVSERYKELC